MPGQTECTWACSLGRDIRYRRPLRHRSHRSPCAWAMASAQHARHGIPAWQTRARPRARRWPWRRGIADGCSRPVIDWSTVAATGRVSTRGWLTTVIQADSAVACACQWRCLGHTRRPARRQSDGDTPHRPEDRNAQVDLAVQTVVQAQQQPDRGQDCHPRILAQSVQSVNGGHEGRRRGASGR